MTASAGASARCFPSTEPGQTIFDESAASGRLEFASQERAGTRMGVFSGWLEGVHELSYRFRVQSTTLQTPLPTGAVLDPVPREIQALYSRPTADYPATAPSVVKWVEDAALPPPSDVAGRLQTVFAFVTHEIATQPLAGDDALLTLDRREGSAIGKERLLVTLMRALGRPARLVHGLELREGASPQPRAWVEVWGSASWISLSASEGFLGSRPQDWIVLGRSASPLVQATGVRAVGHRFRSMRQPLRPDEIAGLMAPDNPLLAWFSLYRLPLGSQVVLQVLLLLPLGALVTALFRNFVGVRTYGTFMPALIALAIRDATPGVALLVVGTVLCVGVFSRLALDRLRLLMVPRLSILLCIVVLSITALALLGGEFSTGDWLSGATLPIVIFTMWIERITITAAEEGSMEAATPRFLDPLDRRLPAPGVPQPGRGLPLLHLPGAHLRDDGSAGLDRWLHRLPRDRVAALPHRHRSRRARQGARMSLAGMRRAGILGINRRNATYMLARNDRRLYPLVDDKLATKALCAEVGVPVPRLIAVARTHREARNLPEQLGGEDAFVLKPARGAMGNGIVVLEQRDGVILRSGRPMSADDLAYHAAGIISGLYSLAGHLDQAIVEERLEIDPAFESIVAEGVPDVRVIIYRGIPVMAMTRLPTRRSGGRANLHQGAVGAGLDLRSGELRFAVFRNRPISESPDTGEALAGFTLPHFDRVVHSAVAVAERTGLAYLGADVVIDARQGPVILELNARPGLAIQLANREGLRPRLEAVDTELGPYRSGETPSHTIEERIALGRAIAEGRR